MKICKEPFDETNATLSIFNNWDFELSNFQKWAIYGLLNNKNVLITAHTGSGKTVPAEAAILHFVHAKKRVIYTSPIKALTNQKFHEFTKKFPDITFGIITGDNKYNPEAQVLLMTAEILRNTLFRKKMMEMGSNEKSSLLSFDMNIEDELGCVIIDEAHYINDADRGRIWEETIMLLPTHIQLLLLSATLNKPEEQLIPLIESRGGPEVYICPTEKRVVPLTHYAYLTIQQSTLKNMSDDNRNFYAPMFNKLLMLKGPITGEMFQEKTYDKIRKTANFLEKNKIRINKYFVLNELVILLKNKNLLPAIVFVFSRNQVDILASKIQLCLHDTNSKMSSTVDKECEQLLRSKLPNWKEYTMLPEYEVLITHLRKGIAIHHAGILKEFREMIELLFDKGYVKLLFATETFAVGINMPTKTTVFTSLEKFDGNSFRYLEPSEYTQMSGRAGRRGIDEKGIVIHANNLFCRNEIPNKNYRHILTGPPKSISSKFAIHPNLILQLISSGNINFDEFIARSMISKDIKNNKKAIQTELDTVQDKISNRICSYRTPIDELERLCHIDTQIEFIKGKKRKNLLREYRQILDQSKFVKPDYELFVQNRKVDQRVVHLKQNIVNIDSWINRMCKKQVDILMVEGFINNEMELTRSGKYALCLQEVFSLPIGELLDSEWLSKLSAVNIVSVLSCFTNMRLPEEQSVLTVESINAPENVKEGIRKVAKGYNKYTDIFNINRIDSVENTDLQFNLCEMVIKWCNCSNENTCKEILQECKYYNIGLGDFVKAILKINNISKEFINVATISDDVELLSKLSKIPELTLKFCVTNQSLYL